MSEDLKRQRACRWCGKVLNPHPTQQISDEAVQAHEDACFKNPKNAKYQEKR